jgi:uncharacterized membrane protein YGL010W
MFQLLYAPQMAVSLLTATAYAHRPDGIRDAIIVQVISWIAQFLGHGLAEGRAPALLDNIVGGGSSIKLLTYMQAANNPF